MAWHRKIYLVMTGTIVPHDSSALIALSVEERKVMYLRAFRWYVDKLRREGSRCGYDGVVFCENSGADLSEFETIRSGEAHVELLSAPPEIFPAHLGKNNDFNIVDYAVENSTLLKDPDCSFVKLTGRYYITNINDLIHDVTRCGEGMEYYCDLRQYNLPTLRGRIHHESDAEARYFFVTRDFWLKNFYQCYRRDPRNQPVENFIWGVAKSNLKNKNCRVRFWREAYIAGDEYTSKNAPHVRCWGIRLPPEIYFKVRAVRWRVETLARHLFPWIWF